MGNGQVNYDIKPNGAVLYGFVEGIGLKPALDIAFKIAGKTPISNADIQANIQNNPGFEENYSIGQTFAIIPALSGAMSGGTTQSSPAYSTSNGSITVQPATVDITAPIYFSSDSNSKNNNEEIKPSLKPFKNNKEANKIAQKLGYDNAEYLKQDYVGREGAKFNIKYDTNTREIYLESIKDGVQIPTGLYK